MTTTMIMITYTFVKKKSIVIPLARRYLDIKYLSYLNGGLATFSCCRLEIHKQIGFSGGRPLTWYILEMDSGLLQEPARAYTVSVGTQMTSPVSRTFAALIRSLAVLD